MMPDLGLAEVILLVLAGLVSGALNAAAGGGSLVSFPALLVVGYPAVLANVTNNVAAWPGYVSGAWGYRGEMAGQWARIWPMAMVGTLGGVAGVGLLLVSPPGTFEAIVPFLVLVAVALIAVDPLLKKLGKGDATGDRPGLGALVSHLGAAVYGGYFGAAVGVAILALLGLHFDDSLQRLNGLKAALQLVIGTASAVGFMILAPVAWVAVAILGVASLLGGWIGAGLARKLSDRTLRMSIVAYGLAAAIWLFVRG